MILSSPEPKAQVSFSDQNLSFVRRCRCHWRCRCRRRKLFIFSYSSPARTTGSISTKLGTKYPWVKGSQVCANEGPRPFPRGDNFEILKIH